MAQIAIEKIYYAIDLLVRRQSLILGCELCHSKIKYSNNLYLQLTAYRISSRAMGDEIRRPGEPEQPPVPEPAMREQPWESATWGMVTIPVAARLRPWEVARKMPSTGQMASGEKTGAAVTTK